MNIKFVLPGGGRAGGVRSTVKAANGLLRKGHNVRLLVYNNETSLRDRLRSLMLKARYAHNHDWLDCFEGSVERFDNIERCHFEDDEIVVASGEFAAVQLRRIKKDSITKVHHIRGIGVHDPVKMREIWGEDVPKIAIASYLKDVIREMCGQEISAVIPNGIDVSEYFPSVPENQRDGVGTIFGIAYHKAPQTVLGVLEELHRIRPEVPLRVFGACRKAREIPRRIYKRLPTMEMAREIYSRSQVWFLGSYSEGFSLPVLEAMACGCAVVATDCGGPRDLIVDGENGFLVEVNNVKQIVDRIKLLLDDQGLRQKLVEKSKETVRKFSWDNSVNTLETFLHSLAKNHRTNCEGQMSANLITNDA